MFWWLSFLVFQAQLIWGIFSFGAIVIWSLTLATVKKRQSLLIIFLTFSFIATLFSLHISPMRHQVVGPTLQKPKLADKRTIPLQQMTYAEVQQTYAATQELLELQPNHRDVLINAALLAEQLNLPGEAQQYWLQAQRLDPNAEIFNN